MKIFLNMSKVDETPELGGEAHILSPPSASVPVAANGALKLPVFWLRFGLLRLTPSSPSDPSLYPRQSSTMPWPVSLKM